MAKEAFLQPFCYIISAYCLFIVFFLTGYAKWLMATSACVGYRIFLENGMSVDIKLRWSRPKDNFCMLA